jgi:hypothetical protein
LWKSFWGCRDRMVVEFTTTCVIEPRSWRGVLDAVLLKGETGVLRENHRSSVLEN